MKFSAQGLSSVSRDGWPRDRPENDTTCGFQMVAG
jgi:hypothetical protein